MSKIYTKTGDDGTTGLLSGERVSKSDLRLEAYGQVDHLNSYVSILINSIAKEKELELEKHFLINIQNKLFNLGALLSCPQDARDKFRLNKIEDSFIREIEERIDYCDSKLDKLSNFILPGGSLSASYAHLCRTQTRNVERVMISSFDDQKERPENGILFINRLSDYFFNLSRLINKLSNIEEVIWEA